MRLKPSTIASWILLAGLSGVVVLESQRDPVANAMEDIPIPPAGQAAGTGTDAPPLAPLAALAPADSFGAVSERPLFTATRRPPELQTEETPAATNLQPTVQPTNLLLSAIILEGDTRLALLQTTSPPGEIQQINEGGVFNGWTVAEIRDESVLLRTGDRTAELQLRKFQSSMTVSPGAARRPRAAAAPAAQRVRSPAEIAAQAAAAKAARARRPWANPKLRGAARAAEIQSRTR